MLPEGSGKRRKYGPSRSAGLEVELEAARFEGAGRANEASSPCKN